MRHQPAWDQLIFTHFRIIANYKAGGPGWQLIAKELPTFLYDERAGWNVNNMKKGLLRGHILVRVCYIHMHIFPFFLPLRAVQVALRVFRNRTAADDDTLDGWFNPNKPRMGPKCILDRGEYTKITRGIVAYAAVQVRLLQFRHRSSNPDVPIGLCGTLLDAKVGPR